MPTTQNVQIAAPETRNALQAIPRGRMFQSCESGLRFQKRQIHPSLRYQHMVNFRQHFPSRMDLFMTILNPIIYYQPPLDTTQSLPHYTTIDRPPMAIWAHLSSQRRPTSHQCNSLMTCRSIWISSTTGLKCWEPVALNA